MDVLNWVKEVYFSSPLLWSGHWTFMSFREATRCHGAFGLAAWVGFLDPFLGPASLGKPPGPGVG